jgi:hypothetical protein
MEDWEERRTANTDLVQDLGMNTADIAQARSFVLQAELPPAFPEILGESAPGDISPFDAAKHQAAVVGSDVVSFLTEITPERRQDIVNASRKGCWGKGLKCRPLPQTPSPVMKITLKDCGLNW